MKKAKNRDLDPAAPGDRTALATVPPVVVEQAVIEQAESLVGQTPSQVAPEARRLRAVEPLPEPGEPTVAAAVVEDRVVIDEPATPRQTPRVRVEDLGEAAPVRDRPAPDRRPLTAPASEPPVEVVAAPAPTVPEPEAAPATQAVPEPLVAGETHGQPGVRRAQVTARAKQDVVFSWAKSDYEVIDQAFKSLRAEYRQFWSEKDPGGKYRLMISSFTAMALRRALADPETWLDSVRNDARRERVPGGQRQVGLVWPVALAEQLQDVWEDLDTRAWPEGFYLTKANLAAAGILASLPTAPSWVFEVPNDDRYSEPTPLDGRLGKRQA